MAVNEPEVPISHEQRETNGKMKSRKFDGHDQKSGGQSSKTKN